MKVRRNDPCPCGSGKKYKQCCMRKDQEAERVQRSMERARRIVEESRSDSPEPSTPPETPAPPPSDPQVEASSARWQEFEEQDYESQIALFVETLNDDELMDNEMAFEMLSKIYDKTIEHDERDRFDALVDMLREHLPEVYTQSAPYFLDWRITNALVTGRSDVLSSLANEIATTAGRDIDTFNNVLDRLAYHGQLSTLVEMMRIAWPLVKTSDNIVPWGVDESARQAIDYEIFNYLEHSPSPDAGDPEMMRRLEFYLEIDPERLARYMAHLTGRADRHWTMSDFEFSPPRSEFRDDFEDEDEDDEDQPPDEGRQNLFHLSLEFLGYLRREENVSYTKGELAREHIRQYILLRHDDELEPRESMVEAVMRPKRRKPKPKPRKPAHLLCPDRSTLNRYLARLLGFINPQHYKAAATLELVPAWLRFLESRQLLDAPRRSKTLLDLCGLDTELLKVWKKYPSDPALQQGMERWREYAGIGMAK